MVAVDLHNGAYFEKIISHLVEGRLTAIDLESQVQLGEQMAKYSQPLADECVGH